MMLYSPSPRWISYKNWSYEVVFDISSEQTESGGGSVYLDCLGLDTVSSVYINDVMVGVSDNMFIRYNASLLHNVTLPLLNIFLSRYRWNINTLVHIGSNKIRVEFQSPVEFAKQQADLHSSTRYDAWSEDSKSWSWYPKPCEEHHAQKLQFAFSPLLCAGIPCHHLVCLRSIMESVTPTISARCSPPSAGTGAPPSPGSVCAVSRFTKQADVVRRWGCGSP